MYQYKIVKISVDDKEEEINQKLNQIGKEGWELLNFQPSSETHGILSNVEPWTMFYILIFKKKV